MSDIWIHTSRGRILVPVIERRNGLAIHLSVEPNQGEAPLYQITHIASGEVITAGMLSHYTVFAVLIRLLDSGIPWYLPMDQLSRGQINEAVRNALRGNI